MGLGEREGDGAGLGVGAEGGAGCSVGAQFGTGFDVGTKGDLREKGSLSGYCSTTWVASSSRPSLHNTFARKAAVWLVKGV